MKSFKLFYSVLAVILLLSGCSSKNQYDFTSDKNISYNQDIESEKNEGNSSPHANIYNSGDSTEQITQESVEDYIKKLENSNVAASAMFLSPADPDCFAPLVYNGGDFVFYYQIGSSTEKEFAVGFTLNGVYQDIKIEHNGNTTDYATMHKVTLSAGQNKVLKIMLRPNIGRKGEVLQFCNATICSTETKVTQDNSSYTVGYHDLSSTLVSTFIMNSDSTGNAAVNSSYKNISIGNYSKNLKEHFTLKNETEEICQMVIYNELEKIVYNDDDIYRTLLFNPIIEAQPSTLFPLTIAMSGKPGTTQRISLYVNDEILPVFDGEYYADVKMEKGKQTTVTVTLDTSELDTWNNLYCITSTHNADAMDIYALTQSDVYVLKIIN